MKLRWPKKKSFFDIFFFNFFFFFAQDKFGILIEAITWHTADQSFLHGLGSSPPEPAILLKPFQFSIAVTIMAIFTTFENHFIFAIFG